MNFFVLIVGLQFFLVHNFQTQYRWGWHGDPNSDKGFLTAQPTGVDLVRSYHIFRHLIFIKGGKLALPFMVIIILIYIQQQAAHQTYFLQFFIMYFFCVLWLVDLCSINS
eukprot:TRINITY_DN9793_c0_g1_i2.p6 TRINITY_DN9793_c0_g1~~TRINITY_DN9793_c0_g1_i2.p6  ORF type:complete len:110 (-),score=4.68 TRINITY_DN9793_c0_g1_i2:215-544(-)